MPIQGISAQERGFQLKREIEAFKKSKVEGWEELVMKRVRKSRFEDPEQELARLRSEGILSLDVEAKVDRAVQNFHSKDTMKSMLGQALEIQSIYGSSNHVFTHAQCSKWPFADLVKEIMKVKYPEKDLHHFKFLRLPGAERNYGIERYSEAIVVDDHSWRKDLISVDGYFFNNHSCESALDFLSVNRNIMDDKDKIKNCSEEALKFFYPSIKKTDLKKYATQFSEMKKTASLGNLFVFCLPKKISSQIQYRSHSIGTPCTCHSKKNRASILNQLQQGKLHRQTGCFTGNSRPPQFRLFTPALTKENGVKVFLLSPDKQKRKQEKLEIRSLVQEIHKKYNSDSQVPSNNE
jgi:hypothetical protein